jgi:hypothetical protein
MGSSRKYFLGGGDFVAEVIAGIPELIEIGKKFTFANFASKNERGFPNALSDDWLVWTHHIHGLITKIGQSPIADSITRGLGIGLIGNGQDKFESAKALIISGLQLNEFLAKPFRRLIEPFHSATIPQSRSRH